MKSDNAKIYKYFSIILFLVMIIFSLLIYVEVYIHSNVTSRNALLRWTVQYHLEITITMIIISGIVGYTFSSLMMREIIAIRTKSRSILETLFLFLDSSEKDIITYLCDNEGEGNQADISRLPNMGRVKAHRILQKLSSRGIVEITPHGKIRKVKLNNNIKEILNSDQDNKRKVNHFDNDNKTIKQQDY